VRDKSEWIETPMPDLRIVDDALWARVQARRVAVSNGVVALRVIQSRAHSTGRDPKYLFSGLLVCGVCGGRFVICDPTQYGCSLLRTRGTAVCANRLRVPRALVETRLLAAIQRDLFTEEGLAVFTQEVARLLAEHRRTRKPDLAQATARLQAVEQEIAHIMAAIKAGIFTPSTKAALEQAEAERTRLRQTVQGRHKGLDQVATLLPNMVERFKRVVEDLATVTQHQVDKARGILRDLVGPTIPLYPTADGATRFLAAELAGDYAGLVRLACGPKLNINPLFRIR
jgi:site-specific DNA recombinase